MYLTITENRNTKSSHVWGTDLFKIRVKYLFLKGALV